MGYQQYSFGLRKIETGDYVGYRQNGSVESSDSAFLHNHAVGPCTHSGFYPCCTGVVGGGSGHTGAERNLPGYIGVGAVGAELTHGN